MNTPTDIYKKMGQRAFGSTTTSAKRATSPAGGTAAKKPAVEPTGLFQGHQNAAQTTESSQHVPPANEPRVPAIFLDGIADWETRAAEMDKLLPGDLEATATDSGYRIKTRTIADYRAVQHYLCKAKLPFHTFSLGGQRHLKVVVSGLPADTTPDKLTDHLRELGFDVQEAVRLHSTRGPTKSWLVTFATELEKEDGCRPAPDIYGLRRILWVQVRISPYRKPAGPPQCHRCQGFGHGSSNCYRPLRCVRCGDSHVGRACPKPQGERGVCCNCSGQHNANYRGCPSYKAAQRNQLPGRKAKPTQAVPQTAEKTATPADESTAEDLEDDTTPDRRRKKRRKRPPRNPTNRRPRTENNSPPPKQRSTPRQRIDWPPKTQAKALPTTPQPKPAAPQTPDAPPTLDEVTRQLTISLQSEETIMLLAKVLQHLTALTGLITSIFPGIARA